MYICIYVYIQIYIYKYIIDGIIYNTYKSSRL